MSLPTDTTVVRLTITRGDLFALSLAASYAATAQRKAARDDFPADEYPSMNETCTAAAERLDALAAAIHPNGQGVAA